MIANSRLAVLFVGLGLVASSAPASAQNSPVGVWIDDTGRGAIEITECGGKLCGSLVWVKDSPESKACGTAIIGDVAKVGESWDGGWIYSPESDDKYDVELTPKGTDTLTVLGYAGTKLFSREMTWTRAPADLKRCSLVEANAAPVAPTQTAEAKSAPPPAETAASPLPAPAVLPLAKSAEGKPAAPTARAKDAPVKTAQADVKPDKPAAKPRAKPRKRMCTVEAPFVTVDYPCDDD